MNKIILAISLFILSACNSANQRIERNINMVPNSNVSLWSEAFGKPSDPALLLIAGAGLQSITWPEQFCTKLASQGYYVIRYDHRDTGKSSSVDYDMNPYNIMDLTKDAIAVLDNYHISKAGIVGFSMGGQIAQFIGAYYPERAKSLTIISSSSSFKEAGNAARGHSYIGGLSAPKDYYLKWVTRSQDLSKQSIDDKIANLTYGFMLLNGGKVAFDEQLYRDIAEDSFNRSKFDIPYYNHRQAMQASYNEHQQAVSLIRLPSLIIHGNVDPLFGVDHAQALLNGIVGSKLVIIEGMGHLLNTKFYNQIISLIKENN